MLTEKPKKAHKIPECFEIKIRQDAEMKELKRDEVVSFVEYKRLKEDIDLTRYSCQTFIKNQRGGKAS